MPPKPCLGFGRIVIGDIPGQLPDEEFLNEIGAGSYTNPDCPVSER